MLAWHFPVLHFLGYDVYEEGWSEKEVKRREDRLRRQAMEPLFVYDQENRR